MKIKPSIKRRCQFCKILRRNQKLSVICFFRRHNQKQG